MLVLNANVNIFNSYGKSLKLYNLHFVALVCICISSRQKVETPHKTNSTVFTSLLESCTFCPHPALSLLTAKEGPKGKGTESLHLSLSVSSFQPEWLANMGKYVSKKDIVGCLGCSCTLVAPFFLHLKQVLVQMGSVASQDCQCSVYSVLGDPCLPCSHFESC